MSSMNQFHLPKMGLLLIPLFFLITKVEAQTPNDQANSNPQDAGSTNVQPSLSIVIGILSLMFSITFVLLVYARFCRRGRGDPDNPPAHSARSVSTRFSGIDKSVIESLPYFQFSSLKGVRQGLECSVCLSRFEDVEILRMLPKCKHGFHVDCIDRWLEKHSSCPLCRRKVDAEDSSLFTRSSSMRVANSGDGGVPSFEVFVEREESSRFSGIGGSFRRIFRGNANGSNLSRHGGDKAETGEIREEEEFEFHRFNHRIVFSDVMIQHRWSNLTTSDIAFLSKEMMTNSSTGTQFLNMQSKGEQDEIAEEERKVRRHETKVVSPTERRVMSEITAVKRFTEPGLENWGDARDERMKRLWLPMARRPVHWFATRGTEAAG